MNLIIFNSFDNPRKHGDHRERSVVDSLAFIFDLGKEQCCRAFNGMVALLGRGGRFSNLLSLVLTGKIFYTPDTPQTRRVVQQANLFIKQVCSQKFQ